MHRLNNIVSQQARQRRIVHSCAHEYQRQSSHCRKQNAMHVLLPHGRWTGDSRTPSHHLMQAARCMMQTVNIRLERHCTGCMNASNDLSHGGLACILRLPRGTGEGHRFCRLLLSLQHFVRSQRSLVTCFPIACVDGG
jgi:hypothetical protein